VIIVDPRRDDAYKSAVLLFDIGFPLRDAVRLHTTSIDFDEIGHARRCFQCWL
jgi:hypothetical protein